MNEPYVYEVPPLPKWLEARPVYKIDENNERVIAGYEPWHFLFVDEFREHGLSHLSLIEFISWVMVNHQRSLKISFKSEVGPRLMIEAMHQLKPNSMIFINNSVYGNTEWPYTVIWSEAMIEYWPKERHATYAKGKYTPSWAKPKVEVEIEEYRTPPEKAQGETVEGRLEKMALDLGAEEDVEDGQQLLLANGGTVTVRTPLGVVEGSLYVKDGPTEVGSATFTAGLAETQGSGGQS